MDELDAGRRLEITRESVAKQMASALQEEILAARMPGGYRLREVRLAEAFGVSRAVVREAVQLLVGVGLVTHEPHRGAVVRQLTTAEVHDLYRVRRVVELAAIEYASPDRLDPLEQAIGELTDAVAARDRSAIVNAELSFHRRIVALMGSARMLRVFDDLGSETRLCLALLDNNYPHPERLVEEHEEILTALAAGDHGRARDLLRADLAKGDALFSELTDSAAAGSEDAGIQVSQRNQRKAMEV